MLGIAARTGNRDLVIAIALFLAIGTAVVDVRGGILARPLALSSLGCCSAGERVRHQLEADVEPFKGLLLGLFFSTVG